MTRIAHLSDPHFGTEQLGLPDALARHLATLAPDIIVVSGDLTQRARPAQYAAAARFLAALPYPTLVIPGNHDAPLWNLPLRLLNPWRDWMGVLDRPLQGEWQTDGLLLIALNSANPRVWKDGRLTPAQLDHIATRCAAAGPRRRLVALHHPPEPPRDEPPSLDHAAETIATLERAGVEMVLSGHLHFTHVAPLRQAPGILGVQAGTCLSSRIRGDGNAFTLIDLSETGAAISHHRADTDGRFHPDATVTWRKTPQGWC
ncbi:metallophosphoesterase family protein [Tabrizicola sp. M-4]|uniref:metallophosphoesterase family protein n=1 Tax=Tabrizicola sp. M-4 TaxID=3055847 RepID=UPI003DA9C721